MRLLQSPVVGWRLLGRENQSNRLFAATFATMALVAGFCDVRPFMAPRERLIGHADQAAMANAARSIVEGRGPVVDSLWLLHGGGMPGNDVSHPEDYWSPYVPYFVAPFFWAFGSTLQSVLLAAFMAKLIVAGVAAAWVLQLARSHFAAWLAGFFLLFDRSMTGVVNGNFDVYLTCWMLLALSALALAIGRRSAWFFALAGGLVGVCVGIKASGLLPVGCLLAFLAWNWRKPREWVRASPFLVGMVLLSSPLLVYNFRHFGAIVSPAQTLVHSAARVAYLSGDHNRAFYDPTPFSPGELDGERPRWELPAARLRSFAYEAMRAAILPSGAFLPVWLFPLFGTGMFAGWRSVVRQRGVNLSAPQCMVVIVGLMFVGGLVLACAVDYATRYWNFLVPLFAIATFFGLSRLAGWKRHAAVAVTFVCVLAPAGYFYPELRRAEYRRAEQLTVYRQIERHVPAAAVLLTSNPWQMAYHTRRRCVVLPYTDDPAVVRAVAQRYSATYLAIVDNDARHPSYDSIEQGDFPDWFVPIHRSARLTIGRLRWLE